MSDTDPTVDDAAAAPAADPATPPVDPGTPPADGGDPPAAWHAGLTLDDDQKTVFTARGYDKAESMEEAFRKALTSGRLADAKLRAPADRVLVLPEDGTNADFWKENADRLGVPETVEGYDFERPALPDGMVYDEGLEKRILTKAHELGMPKDMAAGIVGEYAALMAELGQADAGALQSASDTTMDALKSEWGDGYEGKVDLGKRALEQFATAAGFDTDTTKATVARMAQDTGDANVIKLFASIGAAMAEDTITLGDGARIGGALTTEEAKAEYQDFTKTDEYKAAQKQGGQVWREMNAKAMAILDRAKIS